MNSLQVRQLSDIHLMWLYLPLSIGLESVNNERSITHDVNVITQSLIPVSPYVLCESLTWLHLSMPSCRCEVLELFLHIPLVSDLRKGKKSRAALFFCGDYILALDGMESFHKILTSIGESPFRDYNVLIVSAL